ncbi:class I SAM-dependent methyltransferase [Methanobacterium oryzae]|uniref:class I SAM-dependent methyltransferase n=1 Tax=Methanobacterium oryzae TaxID=69540 RepID=UPI003D1F5213
MKIQELLSFLRCPSCYSSFNHDKNCLICSNCNERYPIIDDIPIILTNEEIKDAEIKKIYEELYTNVKEDIREQKNVPSHCFDDLREIENLNIKNKVIVDAGGGRGFIANNLVDDVNKYIIVDLSLTALKELKRMEKDNLFLICGDIQKNIFSKEFADIVICTAVLEHLEDPNKALNNFKNFLKEDGELYIQVPVINLPFKEIFLYIFRKIKKRDIEEVKKIHLRVYSTKSIINDLNSVGFSISYLNYIPIIKEFNLTRLEHIFYLLFNRSLLKKYLASSIQVTSEKRGME